jgi:hypothetical protein
MKFAEIKTFDLPDLVGRTIKIRSFHEGGTELIVAQDAKSGEIFVLKEIVHPTEAHDGK